MLDRALMNYTTPILSVNNKGLISAKNYMAEITFPVVKVGAIVARYTDIDFKCEKLSRAMFCGNEYSYFTMFNNEETLLFICVNSFGNGILPFDAFSLYKERVKALLSKEPYDKNKERHFVRAINSNLVKVNYFTEFSEIFNNKCNNISASDKKSCVVSKIYTGIKLATQNFLEDVDIDFDAEYAYTQRVAQISENDLIKLILNAMYFSISSAKGKINVLMKEDFDHVVIHFTFDSNSSFDRWLSADDNSVLNSSLALAIAMEIAKVHEIKYSLINDTQKYKTNNILEFIIPAKADPSFKLSSIDTLTENIHKYLNIIFLDEIN